MAQTIKLRRSGVEGSVPTTSQLALGEVAINTFDGRAFIHKSGSGAGAPPESIEHLITTNSETTGSINLIGNITASGDISASGAVRAEHFYSSDDATVADLLTAGRFQTVGTSIFGIYATPNLNTSLIYDAFRFYGAITASGNISASGDLLVNTSDAAGSSYNTLMVDTATGKVYHTGSYGGGGGADNLGDHTATQDLNLDRNSIVNVLAVSASATGSSNGSDWLPNIGGLWQGTYTAPTQDITATSDIVETGVLTGAQILSTNLDVGIDASNFDINGGFVTITQIEVKGGGMSFANTNSYGINSISIGGQTLVGLTQYHLTAGNETSWLTIWDGTDLSSSWNTWTDGGGDPEAVAVQLINEYIASFAVNCFGITGFLNTLQFRISYEVLDGTGTYSGGQTGKGVVLASAETSTGNYAAQFWNCNTNKYVSLDWDKAPRGLSITLGRNYVAPDTRSAHIDFFVQDGLDGILNVGSVRYLGGGLNYQTNSDKRLKENITPTDKGLKEILQLTPKEYNFKNHKEFTQVGLIAQEAYDIIPDIVVPGSHDNGSDKVINPWSIDYSKIVPYLINAIKQQQNQIDELKEELKKLK